MISTILPFASAAAAIELAALALQARLLAFEGGEPGDRNQVLCPQVAHAFELLIDEPHFLGLGVLLGGEPDDLLLQLLDALGKLILLTGPGLAPQLEQLALAGQASCTSESSARSASSLGKATVSAPSRSAARRALRA